MTTYTLNGFSMVWSDTTGDGSDDTVLVSPTQIEFVVADNDTSFTYVITAGPSDESGFPRIATQNTEHYNVRLNGQQNDALQFYIGQVEWSPFAISDPADPYIAIAQVLDVSLFGVSHIFNLHGDVLDIDTPEDVYALDDLLPNFGVVTENGWRANDVIDYSDLMSVTISEADRIDGTDSGNTFNGGMGKDTIYGNGGADKIEGDTGHDRLFGGTGHDTLAGGKGKDRLFGGKGDDTLKGQKGHDKLDGGKGDDWLIGGNGEDVFILNDVTGWDTIVDFEDDVDTLRLDSDHWTGNLTVAQVLATYADPHSGEGFSGVAIEFADGSGVFVNGMTIETLTNDIEIF